MQKKSGKNISLLRLKAVLTTTKGSTEIGNCSRRFRVNIKTILLSVLERPRISIKSQRPTYHASGLMKFPKFRSNKRAEKAIIKFSGVLKSLHGRTAYLVCLHRKVWMAKGRSSLLASSLEAAKLFSRLEADEEAIVGGAPEVATLIAALAILSWVLQKTRPKMTC